MPSLGKIFLASIVSIRLFASIDSDNTIIQDKEFSDFRSYVYSKNHLSSGFFFHLADHAYMSGRSFNPKEVQLGDIVFVPEYSIPYFLQKQHKLIKNKYILLVHVSGINYNGNLLKKIVNDPKVISIFTTDASFKHPKLVPIPLGIWPHVPINNRGDNGITKWETLYLGAVPIVTSSANDPLFDDLPVVIIKDIKDVTEKFLLNKLEEMSQKKINLDKLTQKYYINLILSHKKSALGHSRKGRIGNASMLSSLLEYTDLSAFTQRDHKALGALPNMEPPSSFWLLPLMM